MILSLRKRLLIGIIAGTAILLAVFSLMIYTVTKQTMIQHFDKSLLASAKMLSAVVESEGSESEHEGDEHGENEEGDERSEAELDFEFDVSMTPEFNEPNGGAYYQFWFGDENVDRSPSLGRYDLPLFGLTSKVPQFQLCVLPDSKKGLAVSYRFFPRVEKDGQDLGQLYEGEKYILVVAKDASDLYGHLDFLQWLLISLSVTTIIVSTVVAWVITQTSLRPIHALADKIAQIREDDLAQTFPPAQFPAELHPICECMDDLFTRLEHSFERERRFNKDVAHELRTPLSGLQTTIEVCLSRQRQPHEYQDSLQNCLKIVKTMNRMIDALLSLSKIEAGRLTVGDDTIDIKNIVDDCWRNFADTAHDNNVSFQNYVTAFILCRSGKDWLAMIISNTLDNAVEYTGKGGRVWVNAKQGDAFIQLSISNTGCLLTGQEVQHIFEFFWRKDQSRTGTGRHCGIGLSVAKRIAAVLGIDLKAQLEDNNIFTLHLRINRGLAQKCVH
jgi:two-component system sensor histidine kinase QseC